MSYFPDNKVYFIVNTPCVTETMVNAGKISFNITGSASSNSFRKNNDSSKTLVKICKTHIDLFFTHELYNSTTIIAKLKSDADW